MKKTTAKLTAMILALTLVLTMFVGLTTAQADATIDLNATGKIIVYKYANLTPNNSTTAGGTGADNQTVPDGNVAVNGVEFSLYKIADKDAVAAYYDGTSTKTYSVSDADGKSAFATAITGENNNPVGVAVFSNLPVGIYVLKETKTPEQITTPMMDPCLISIPMVNTTTSQNKTDWIYNVSVYPKNHESRGNVELTKTGLNSPLEGVKFKLEKKMDDGTWKPYASAKTDKGDDIEYTQDVLTTNAQGKIFVQNLPAGLNGTEYRLVETETLPGYILNANPIAFKVNINNTISWNTENSNTAVTSHSEDGNTMTIAMQNLQPDLVKQVYKKGTNDLEDEAVYETDDTIKYQITVTVPGNVNELKTFVVQDTPESGIKDVISTIVVKAGSNYTMVKDTDYEVTANDAGNGFVLTFKQDGKNYLKTNNVTSVTINYDAYFTEDYELNENDNTNEATLIYSDVILDGDDNDQTNTIEDDAKVNTYTFEITKNLEDENGNLSLGNGVLFDLYDKNSLKLEVVGSNGVYHLKLADPALAETAVDHMATVNGKIKIEGLEVGTYYLEEVQTIEHYNLLSGRVEIVVTEDATTSVKTIINKKGFVLPQTGSMSFLLFCAIGLVLVVAGGRIILGDRKNRVR